jgi:hypothetical protein
LALRKLQHFSNESIKSEFERFCEEFSKDEVLFLKEWKGEIKIGNQSLLPKWLTNELWWKGELISHPTVVLNFLEQEKIIKKKKKSNNSDSKLKENYKGFPAYAETPNLISYSHLNETMFHIEELDSLSIQKDEKFQLKSYLSFNSSLPEHVHNYFENISQDFDLF